jgi:hypothetical protein
MKTDFMIFKSIKNNLANQHGAGLIDAMIAVFILAIAMTGLSQMLLVGHENRAQDLKEKLASIAVTTGMERIYTMTTNDPVSSYFQICDGSTLGDSFDGEKVGKNHDSGVWSPNPMSATLLQDGICPDCIFNWTAVCNVADNMWTYSVWIKDGAGDDAKILNSQTSGTYIN